MHNLNAYKIKQPEETALSKKKNDAFNDDQKKFSSDKKLWKAFKRGNEDAFIIIYKKYIDGLYSFGRQFCNKELTEDLIQDMFIQLREKRKELPDITNSIRSFLFQCLKRRIFNSKKKKQPIMKTNLWEGLDFEITVSIDEVIMLNEQKRMDIQKVEEALKTLPKKYREVVYYYFHLGMGYNEIKEVLNFSNVKSARNMVYKVIKKIKKKVSKK
ncbi:RNA polymerase sigma factor [Galbibacter pacificus]|uniref:Sigma-70 family RNA polymerase sigma factor n=1 Tax=Galbibacter pacificus TaxID=2996052 RepID=A0ABT6FUD6_9FLAO|nr:sigma-70 family RNA polymerase sigma factor [Galbibacter pacificus]MDG3583647.1 sigma-70 family RNA polymerase sigma factor [Galbibacter pacificus]MDG3586877.1 sigma-70 family RNA polymerase sigma factor [Galbibacter pacificus]